MSQPEMTIQCPRPVEPARVQLSHGGGGRQMQALIRDVFLAAFDNSLLASLHDGATWDMPAGTMAFTTDSYVVRPLFFPGGDIGSLAVHGTINDLAMCGARPIYLSAGFILEEGLSLETLRRIAQSMAGAARAAGVQVVTGDTKVVDRGKADGIYVNTAGIGVVPNGVSIAPERIRPGDAILLSGDVGSHGIAVLSVRDGVAFESRVESDSAPLHRVIADLIAGGIDLHCLRDCTRGGLASALHELATAARVGMRVDEMMIPVQPAVRGACELLGLDALYVANEGRFVAFVPEDQVDQAIAIMRQHTAATSAVRIGEVQSSEDHQVVLRTVLGTHRILDLLSGEQLPRIC